MKILGKETDIKTVMMVLAFVVGGSSLSATIAWGRKVGWWAVGGDEKVEARIQPMEEAFRAHLAQKDSLVRANEAFKDEVRRHQIFMENFAKNLSPSVFKKTERDMEAWERRRGWARPYLRGRLANETRRTE